jgi:cytoskeletal protein RodZ
MGFPIHTIEVPTGVVPLIKDRIVFGNIPNLANAAGSGAGATVTVSVSGLNLPANYSVQVEASQACWTNVTSKTNAGFSVVLTPTSGSVTLAAGTIDVTIFA